MGNWSEDEIVEYLQTGRNVRALAAGPMAEVVEYSTSKLNESDLHAIASYLKRLPAAGLDATTSHPDPREMKIGEAIFIDACAGCHQISGEAVPRAFTPLKGSAVVQSHDPLNVIRVILQGARGDDRCAAHAVHDASVCLEAGRQPGCGRYHLCPQHLG